jgi:membrane fusion protein (multidrug efflux system)
MPRLQKFHRPKWLIPLLSASLITLALIGYWHHQSLFPSTDDAYIKAHTVQITPKVSGSLSAVLIHENQYVKRGQILALIDDAPFQLALSKAKANLERVKEQIAAADLNAQAAQAHVQEAQAEWAQAKADYARKVPLLKKGYVSKADGDLALKTRDVAFSSLKAAQSQLAEALQKRGRLGNDNAELKSAETDVHQAELNLSYTRLIAPANAYVANFDCRPGDVVNAYQNLFALVETDAYWVEANFKETDLKRIHPGQKADITVDMYPGMHWQGEVESLGMNSTGSFSLLPPENSSANWVKVTQRFPIRILIKNHQHEALRMGASAQVQIDTRAP